MRWEIPASSRKFSQCWQCFAPEIRGAMISMLTLDTIPLPILDRDTTGGGLPPVVIEPMTELRAGRRRPQRARPAKGLDRVVSQDQRQDDQDEPDRRRHQVAEDEGGGNYLGGTLWPPVVQH